VPEELVEASVVGARLVEVELEVDLKLLLGRIDSSNLQETMIADKQHR